MTKIDKWIFALLFAAILLFGGVCIGDCLHKDPVFPLVKTNQYIPCEKRTCNNGLVPMPNGNYCVCVHAPFEGIGP